MKKYLKKIDSLGIFFLLILVSSLISCIYVWIHTEERFSMDALKQDMTQYKFVATAENISLTGNSNELTAEWVNQEGHFYISAFDATVSQAPDTSGNEYAKVPSGCRELQVDAIIAGTRNDMPSDSYSLSFMVATYADNEAENSVTEEILLNSNHEGRGRIHSLTIPVTSRTTGYRVMFRVGVPSGENSSGYLKITDFSASFH